MKLFPVIKRVITPNLGESVLKSLPPSQNLFLSILQLFFFPSAPLCWRFHCGWVFRLGAHLANSPCVPFGRPTCGRALHCIGAPNLQTCWRAFRLRCGRAFGHPTSGRPLRCIGAPNLRTCLTLRWGAQPWWGCIKKSTGKQKFVLIHPPAHLLA